MSRIVGMDLGTTYSLVAYVDDHGKAHVIPDPKDPEGRGFLPSVVATQTDGSMSVGWEARKLRVKQPQSVVSSIKRLMGKTPAEIQKDQSFIPYSLQMEEGNVRVKLNEKFFTPPEISALILKALRDRAEHFLCESVDRCVVTVPAYFNENQRRATLEAGRLAGLEVAAMINEPTAASLAYGFHKNKKGIIAVYDLGGGTFDISILKLDQGLFEVLASSGNTHLGGDDIDWKIAKKFLQEIADQFGNALLEDLQLHQKLVEEAERAKCALSHRGSFDVHIVDKDKGLDFLRAFSRFELSDWSRDIIEKTAAPCQDVIKKAGLALGEIQEVILVGGATRMQLVQETVKRIFQKQPHSEINPDEVVALGAALHGHLLSSGKKDKQWVISDSQHHKK